MMWSSFMGGLLEEIQHAKREGDVFTFEGAGVTIIDQFKRKE